MPGTVLEEQLKAAVTDRLHGYERTALILESYENKIKITDEVFTLAVGNGGCGQDVCRLLLDRAGNEIEITSNVLLSAIGNIGEGPEILALLLEKRYGTIKITEDVVMAATANLFGREFLALLLEERSWKIKINEDIVKAAAANIFGHHVLALLLKERDSDIKITEKVIKAATANESVMALLLERRGDEIKITEDIVKAATANESVMALLLDKRGGEIKITEDIVKAATANGSVMTLLLDKRGGEINITEDIVKAATASGSVLALLLERRGGEIKITEDIVKAATANESVMALLLERRGGEIKMTEDIVKAATANESVMALLLDKRGGEIKITEDIVKAATANGSVMTLLLDKRGGEINITEDIVKAATASGSVLALLQRRGEIKITEDIIMAAVANESVMASLLKHVRFWNIKITEDIVKAATANESVLTLLLDKRGSEIIITEDIIKATVTNENTRQGVLSLLLEKRGEEVEIHKDIIKAAGMEKLLIEQRLKKQLRAAVMNFFNGYEKTALLLYSHEDEIKITDELFMLAVKNRGCGRRVFRLLFDRAGREVRVTTNILLAAIANKEEGPEILAFLLERRGDEIKVTEDIIKAATANENVMALLLERRGGEIKITEDIVKAATANGSVMTLLLDKRGGEIKITEDIVKAAIANKSVMALLLERRGGEIKMTEDIVKAATANESVMALLLERRGDEIKITEDIIKAATANENVLALLLEKRDSDIKITADVVKASIANQRAIIYLLKKRGGEIQITEDIIKSTVTDHNGRHALSLLLRERGEEVEITEDVIKTATANESVMDLLLERRGDEIKITEDIVKAATANESVMALLLGTRGDEIKITEDIVKAATANESVMALLLDKRGGEIKITEDIVKAATANGSVMTLLLDKRGGEINITEDVLKAAGANEKDGHNVMALLFEKRGAEIKISEDVVNAAVGNIRYGRDILGLLEKRSDEYRITEGILKAVVANENNGQEILFLLLTSRGDEIKITEDVLMVAGAITRKMALRLYKQSKAIDTRDDSFQPASRSLMAASQGVSRTVRHGMLPTPVNELSREPVPISKHHKRESNADKNYYQRPAPNRPVIDPEGYFGDLEAIQDELAELLNLSDFTNSTLKSSSSCRSLPIALHVDLEGDLSKLSNLMSRILNGYSFLRATQFCQEDFTIITEHPNASDVVRLVPISIQCLRQLADLLDLALEDVRSDEKPATEYDSISNIGAAAGQLFSFIGLNFTDPSDQYSSICYFAGLLRMLSLALFSYAGSHVSPLNEKYTRSHFTIFLPNQADPSAIFFHPVPLACLEKYVGGPVWVFSGTRPGMVACKPKTVLTSIRCFTDLWGPARMIFSDMQKQKVAAIQVERGIIGSRTQTVQVDNAITCHWYSWENPTTKDFVPFDKDALLAIGTPNYGTRFDFVPNINCPTVNGTIGTLLDETSKIKSLGVLPDSWVLDSLNASLGVSKIFVGSFGGVFKKMPGRSRRGCLLLAWADDNPDPRTLTAKVGLEISACTGNALRVPLWELFRSDSVKEYVKRTLPDRLPKSYSSDPSFLDSLDNGFDEFERRWDNLEFQKAAVAIVRKLLQNLAFTGLRANNLDAWFLDNLQALQILDCHQHNWLKFLTDSGDEACLAVISRRCLQCTAIKEIVTCRAESRDLHTALRTAINIEGQKQTANVLRKSQPRVEKKFICHGSSLPAHSQVDLKNLTNLSATLSKLMAPRKLRNEQATPDLGSNSTTPIPPKLGAKQLNDVVPTLVATTQPNDELLMQLVTQCLVKGELRSTAGYKRIMMPTICNRVSDAVYTVKLEVPLLGISGKGIVGGNVQTYKEVTGFGMVGPHTVQVCIM